MFSKVKIGPVAGVPSNMQHDMQNAARLNIYSKSSNYKNAQQEFNHLTKSEYY